MKEIKNLLAIFAGVVAVVLIMVCITVIFGKLNFLGFAVSVFLSWIVFIIVTDWMLKK